MPRNVLYCCCDSAISGGAVPYYKAEAPSSQSTAPYTTAASVPYTMTGPAMRNIFAPVPGTRPSALNSMAALTTALAKPVMAPATPPRPLPPASGTSPAWSAPPRAKSGCSWSGCPPPRRPRPAAKTAAAALRPAGRYRRPRRTPKASLPKAASAAPPSVPVVHIPALSSSSSRAPFCG